MVQRHAFCLRWFQSAISQRDRILLRHIWADSDGDGMDDYPHSILDFAFVAGLAKEWSPKSRVIVRGGDFPDEERTSDHRPIELTFSLPDGAGDE